MPVYTHDGPGDWRQFILREDVKNLPTMEQRSQFLKESYEFESFKNAQAFLQSNSLNSLNNQQHQGGNLKNKVLSATYGGTFTSISSNTTYIDVTFQENVSIYGSGVPFIEIVNGQQGGGSLANFPYAYASGADSKTLRFTHVHPSTPGNNGGAAANVLGASKVMSLVGATDPQDADAGTFANVTYTTDSAAGATSTFDVTVTAGGVLSEIVDDLLPSITTNPSNCKTGVTTGVSFENITGTGVGATGSIGTTGTSFPTITSIVITTPGSGYEIGDQLRIPAGALGTGQLVTSENLLSQTTTAGIGNVTGPFTIAITSTSAVGTGGTIQLQGNGANAIIGSVSRTIGTGYVNGEVLTISNADLLAAGFAGATGDVVITLQASNVQDSNAAIITLDASDFVTGITAVTSGIAGNGWVPGDEIIFDNAQFGATSTGGSILIQAGDLTGDILTLVGTSIDENGSEIYNSPNNPGAQLDLSYTSNSTLTVVAS
jgi:hypothetical protein